MSCGRAKVDPSQAGGLCPPHPLETRGAKYGWTFAPAAQPPSVFNKPEGTPRSPPPRPRSTTFGYIPHSSSPRPTGECRSNPCTRVRWRGTVDPSALGGRARDDPATGRATCTRGSRGRSRRGWVPDRPASRARRERTPRRRLNEVPKLSFELDPGHPALTPNVVGICGRNRRGPSTAGRKSTSELADRVVQATIGRALIWISPSRADTSAMSVWAVGLALPSSIRLMSAWGMPEASASCF